MKQNFLKLKLFWNKFSNRTFVEKNSWCHFDDSTHNPQP